MNRLLYEPRVATAALRGVRSIAGEVARARADAVAHELGAKAIHCIVTLAPFCEPRLGQCLQVLDALEKR